MKGYRLRKNEIARQVHHVVSEIYRDYDIDGDAVAGNIRAGNSDEPSFVFHARQFAENYNIEPADFIENVSRELDIEYEKNLHDRFLFSMSHDESDIYFRQVDGIE